MKKLLVLTTALLFAVVGNAVEISWGVLNSPPVYSENVIAFYAIGEKGLTDRSHVLSLLAAGDINTAIDLSIIGAVNLSSDSNFTVGTASVSNELLKDPFFIIFNTSSLADATEYFCITGVDHRDGGLYDYMSGNFSVLFDIPEVWQPIGGTGAIPEPTSGLLLLVGAGLMALRRRRV